MAETKTHTTTPVRTAPSVDPDRHYNPERLCPGSETTASARAGHNDQNVVNSV